jgi:hypothetical protein
MVHFVPKEWYIEWESIVSMAFEKECQFHKVAGFIILPNTLFKMKLKVGKLVCQSDKQAGIRA